MYDILSQCILFKGLGPTEIESLLAPTHTFTKRSGPGEMIALSGETCNHLMIVIEGSVKGEMVDYSGRVIKIEDIPASRVLASAFIFGKDNRFPVNIIANEKCTILYIPKYEFLKLLQGNLQILNNFLNSISNRAQFLSNKIKFLSFKTIRGKLVQYLLKESRSRQSFELPASQTNLAELFGVTRPALGRVFHELQEKGVVRVHRRRVEIPDHAKLRAILERTG